MFCRFCGTETLADSSFCGECGKPTGEPASIEALPGTPAKMPGFLASMTPRNRNISIGAGAAVVLLVIVGISGGFENPDVRECKALVLENLKSPSSAIFGETTVEYSTDGEDGSRTISVNGSVEAENGFGVMVSADFWCTNFNTDYLELEYLS